jgi:hypothetical protein
MQVVSAVYLPSLKPHRTDICRNSSKSFLILSASLKRALEQGLTLRLYVIYD